MKTLIFQKYKKEAKREQDYKAFAFKKQSVAFVFILADIIF